MTTHLWRIQNYLSPLFEVVGKIALRCIVGSKRTNLVETMERLKEENVTALGNLTFRKVVKSDNPPSFHHQPCGPKFTRIETCISGTMGTRVRPTLFSTPSEEQSVFSASFSPSSSTGCFPASGTCTARSSR